MHCSSELSWYCLYHFLFPSLLTQIIRADLLIINFNIRPTVLVSLLFIDSFFFFNKNTKSCCHSRHIKKDVCVWNFVHKSTSEILSGDVYLSLTARLTTSSATFNDLSDCKKNEVRGHQIEISSIPGFVLPVPTFFHLSLAITKWLRFPTRFISVAIQIEF